MSVNYSSDEVTPTLQEYARQLLAVCPTLSSVPLPMQSVRRGERGEGGDADNERPQLTIITGAPHLLYNPFSLFILPSHLTILLSWSIL